MRLTHFNFTELCLISLLTALFFGAPPGASPLVLAGCLAVFYTLVGRALLMPVMVRPGLPTFMTPKLLFFFFYFLLFYYPYQLYLLGFTDMNRSIFLRRTYVEHANLAMIAATIGVLAFDFGVDAGLRGRALRVSGKRTASRSLPVFCLTLQLVLMAAYFALGFRAASEGRYTGTSSGGQIAEGIYLIILLLAMVGTGEFIRRLAQRKPLPPGLLLAMGVNLLWITRILLAGDRNSFMLFGIFIVGGLFTYVWRATRLHLLAFLMGALVLYQSIEVLRMTQTMPFKDALAVSLSGNAISAGDDNSFNITTIGLRATFAVVPEKVDYGYGLYKLVGFMGVVPLLRGVVFGDSLTFDTTSKLLKSEMLEPTAGWGVGSNIITDFYADFGLPGVIFGMMLWGCFVGCMQKTATVFPESAKVATLYLLTLALFAEIPRYSADFPVRPLVWAFLLYQAYQALVASRLGRTPTQPGRLVAEHQRDP